MNKSIMEEIKRVSGGYMPISKAWYYQILYDTCKLVIIIRMSIGRVLIPRSNKNRKLGEK